jgi:curved DNA-binding protein CbpA
MDSKFETEVVALSNLIDQMDYYQILRVERTASLGEIRKAYHLQSRQFHPDRYFHFPDGTFKVGIQKIAKRVAEAYVVLRDAQKRKQYDEQLACPGGNLRYTEQSEQAQQQAKTEEDGKTEQGRRYCRQGLSELSRKNFAAAEKSFKLALVYEPENERFKLLKEEAAKNIKTDFTIK